MQLKKYDMFSSAKKGSYGIYSVVIYMFTDEKGGVHSLINGSNSEYSSPNIDSFLEGQVFIGNAIDNPILVSVDGSGEKYNFLSDSDFHEQDKHGHWYFKNKNYSHVNELAIEQAVEDAKVLIGNK